MAPEPSPAERILGDTAALDAFLGRTAGEGQAGSDENARFDGAASGAARRPARIDADPENLEKGLAQLVLTVVELLRQLMERQAVRRMEGGTLDDEEIERLGQAFMALEQRMEELKETFGLDDEDLNLDLGPLGQLL